MTNLEKILAIRDKITVFGGTIISLKNCDTIMGFGQPCTKGRYYMLRDITADGKLVGRNGEGHTISIPIHWFSESYLYSVLGAYARACKEQLTDSAYEEIEKIIEIKQC